MLAEIAIAFVVVVLSIAGLGIGMAFGRSAPTAGCGSALAGGDGECPVCSGDCSKQDEAR